MRRGFLLLVGLLLLVAVLLTFLLSSPAVVDWDTISRKAEDDEPRAEDPFLNCHDAYTQTILRSAFHHGFVGFSNRYSHKNIYSPEARKAVDVDVRFNGFFSCRRSYVEAGGVFLHIVSPIAPDQGVPQSRLPQLVRIPFALSLDEKKLIDVSSLELGYSAMTTGRFMGSHSYYGALHTVAESIASEITSLDESRGSVFSRYLDEAANRTIAPLQVPPSTHRRGAAPKRPSSSYRRDAADLLTILKGGRYNFVVHPDPQMFAAVAFLANAYSGLLGQHFSSTLEQLSFYFSSGFFRRKVPIVRGSFAESAADRAMSQWVFEMLHRDYGIASYALASNADVLFVDAAHFVVPFGVEAVSPCLPAFIREVLLPCALHNFYLAYNVSDYGRDLAMRRYGVDLRVGNNGNPFPSTIFLIKRAQNAKSQRAFHWGDRTIDLLRKHSIPNIWDASPFIDRIALMNHARTVITTHGGLLQILIRLWWGGRRHAERYHKSDRELQTEEDRMRMAKNLPPHWKDQISPQLGLVVLFHPKYHDELSFYRTGRHRSYRLDITPAPTASSSTLGQQSSTPSPPRPTSLLVVVTNESLYCPPGAWVKAVILPTLYLDDFLREDLLRFDREEMWLIDPPSPKTHPKPSSHEYFAENYTKGKYDTLRPHPKAVNESRLALGNIGKCTLGERKYKELFARGFNEREFPALVPPF